MIDQRALDKATAALAGYIRANPPLQFQNKHTGQVDAIISDMHARACIEAYEAALWRPIEEAPRDGAWIIIWAETGSINPLYFAQFNADGGAPPFWLGKGFALSHVRAQELGAMFRTIDPPKQDAVCSALGGSSAAEDPSSARVTSSDRASSPDGSV